jgi:hypothetical protein
LPFTCPCCGAVSYNATDREQNFCGACHWWTGDPALGPPHLEEPCAARDLHDELREGIATAERGETVDLGSFARYGGE